MSYNGLMSPYHDLPEPFFVLAPMDDVTDTVFRQIVADCAPPDLCMTEFVNTDGLQSPGRPNLLKKLRFTADEPPLIAQIWGREPENFYQTARQIAAGTFAREFGLPAGTNYAGVDLNMGCPHKTEIKNGTCAALMNNRPLAQEIIQATREGLAAAHSTTATPTAATSPLTATPTTAGQTPSGRLPLSVKTRIGYQAVDLTWIEFLLQQDLAMLTVHGRTKAQLSQVPADWDIIGQARELRDRIAPGTLIVGNGDVLSRAQGLALSAKYRLDGIMIGRGVFHDPFAFAAEPSPWPDYTEQQRRDLYRAHIQRFAATWRTSPSTYERPLHTLNKFCKIYIQNFPGAKDLRETLMSAKTLDELLSHLG